MQLHVLAGNREATARELIRAGVSRQAIRRLVALGSLVRERGVLLPHVEWSEEREKHLVVNRLRTVYRAAAPASRIVPM